MGPSFCAFRRLACGVCTPPTGSLTELAANAPPWAGVALAAAAIIGASAAGADMMDKSDGSGARSATTQAETSPPVW